MSTKKDDTPAPEPTAEQPEPGAPAQPEQAPQEEPAVRRFTDPSMLALAELGTTLVGSRYFKDAARVSQSMVKVMAGRDLGLSPIASMTGIHIVEGKIEIGATLLAALVKRHPGYDYRVTQHTPEVCTISFFEVANGQKELLGESDFTIADAKNANLVKDGSAWKKYPRAMLFARAMSQGVKWFCPDVMSGTPVYVEGEISGEDPTDYIDVTPVRDSAPAEKPPPTTSQPKEDAETPGVPAEAVPHIHADTCPAAADVTAWCDCRGDA